MNSNFIEDKEEELDYEDEKPQQGSGLIINCTKSYHPSFYIPSSPIAIKHNKHSNKQNLFLDRLRCQLTNIKSQVFKISRDHDTPTKSFDQFQKYSWNSQPFNSKKDIHYPILPSKYVFTHQIDVLNSNYLLLQSKLQQNQLKYKQQKSQLTSTLVSLQRQLLEKYKRLEQYEEQVYFELEKFKQEMVSYYNSQNLKERINQLQLSLQQMNDELIYFKKRTQQDGISIKKLTIQNHELQKYQNNVGDIEEYNIKQVKQGQKLHSQQKLNSVDIDEFNTLKYKNKCMAEQILLQQNTIDVLQFELAKLTKQSKRIEIRGRQEIQNIKTTYQKLLQSVKQGLAQCYRSEIEDLRAQLSKYYETQNITQVIKIQNIFPLRKTQPQVGTEAMNEIIIIQQDEALEVTSRKWSPTQSQKISSQNTSRQALKKRVQELQQMIQELQQYIQHLKQALEQSNNTHNISNNQSINKINQISKQRDDIFNQYMMKQYIFKLEDSLISALLQQQLVNKKYHQNIICVQMQFVIQKLKIRNYQIQKQLRQSQETVRNKDELIDELKRCLLDMKQKQSDQMNSRQRVSIQINTLQAQNFRLQNFQNVQRNKSQISLKQVNQQVQNLINYKLDLERQITRRQQKIKMLKQQITSILESEQRKRQNNRFISNDKSLKRNNQELQKQSDYYIRIIEDLTCQINSLQNHEQRNNMYTDSMKDKEIKQLQIQIFNKNQEILKIKNQFASRFHFSKFRSQKQLEKMSWLKQKKDLELKFEKHIKSLIQDLSLQKQTVQFLTSQIKSQTLNKLKQTNNLQNIPLESLIQSRKTQPRQRHNIKSLILDSFNQHPKLFKQKTNKSMIRLKQY